MKIKIRPGDTSLLQDNDWLQTDGWLAGLRDDGGADPAGDGHAQPARGDDPWPQILAEAAARARAEAAARADAARAEAAARADAARAEAAARADAARADAARAEAARAEAARAEAARAEMTERAVIGDQLRMPVMRCEMGSCISWHADPAALGEADTRARAIGAGWRIDALGRLACPVPADRPRLLGLPSGRAMGPVHGHRQGRPGHRRAQRRHRRRPGKQP